MYISQLFSFFAFMLLFEINISYESKKVADHNQRITKRNTDEELYYNKTKRKTLHIAGFFPMTGTGGWIGGSGCLPAIQLALEDVNAREDLLPGYELKLAYKDSQCNPGKAARFMYDMIYYPPKKFIIICGCSTVCSIVAESANMWNLIVVGYGASSPALSDRSRFPTFFRTHPSATIHNPTRIKLFEKFGWSRVAIILETEEVFIETARDLEERCRLKNIQVLTRVSFVRHPSDAMDNLKRADPRIIIGMFYKQQARRVMCEAYKRGMYGEKYVWFLIGWYEDNWWTDVTDLACTYEQMKTAIDGHLTTEGLVLNQDNRTTISGYRSRDWLQRYRKKLFHKVHSNIVDLDSTNEDGTNTSLKKASDQERPEGYQEAPLAYDAIWAIALALNKTIFDLGRFELIEQFNYTQDMQIKHTMLNNIRTTNFLGISGNVAFSDIGDRIAWTQIEQMIEGNYTVIGYYDNKTNNLIFNDTKIKWARGEPPRDRTIIKEFVQYLSLPSMISIFGLSLVGIIGSIGLIIFNYSNQDDLSMRICHPQSNTIMLIGCIILLISAILFGLDGRFIPPHRFWIICDSRAWFINIGFSMFFGSMFWKVWQSYVLSTRNTSLFEKKNSVSIMVGIFCLIDIAILLAWKIKEPMDRTTVKIREQPGIEMNMDDDTIVELKIEFCQANLYWYYIIFGYKGLLLVFGLFLAYETRSVKLRQLSDSKLVGMCIYNVAIMCFITGPVSLVTLMRQQVNYHYLFVALTIIFCCSLSMILVFIPKVVDYYRKERSKLGAGQSAVAITQEEKSSKDEEERYNRLERDGKELDEKLREKECQIKAITNRIEAMRELAAKTMAVVAKGNNGLDQTLRARRCVDGQLISSRQDDS